MDNSDKIPKLEEIIQNLTNNLDMIKISIDKMNEKMKIQDMYLNLDYKRIQRNEKSLRSIFYQISTIRKQSTNPRNNITDRHSQESRAPLKETSESALNPRNDEKCYIQS